MMQELRKLTLINKSFVLPMLVACRDKGMMTNRLLNQDFVLELLDVIVENYLRGKTADKKCYTRSVGFVIYLRLLENFECERLRIAQLADLVNRPECSLGDERNNLEFVLYFSMLHLVLR